MHCAVPCFCCDTVVTIPVGELPECILYVIYTVRTKWGPLIIQIEYGMHIATECIDFKDYR
jgi:hypothetical protein